MVTPRRTPAGALAISGIGVHTGAPARVRIAPAPFGSGRAFYVDGRPIPADLAHAEARTGSTVLTDGTASVGTPEHLLAALHLAGISDVRLDLDGPEVPILDGSARAWLDAISSLGTEDGPPWDEIVVRAPFSWDGHGGSVHLAPADGFELAVEVDFGSSGPRGRFAWDGDPASVADARTFVRASDVDRLRAAGLGRGADASNTVVVAAGDPSEEPVRHKALDAIGDLALLGAPIRGRLTVIRGSHRLHVDALRAWRA